MDFAIGSFAQKTSTGSQAITGVGFQPKALILVGQDATADGLSPNIEFAYGVSISATERWSFGNSAIDFLNDIGKRIEETAINAINDGLTPTLVGSADFTSFDADGFTINWGTADGTARIINYIAFGGSDLTVDADLLNSPASTGTQSETTAFNPDGLLFYGFHGPDTIPDNDGSMQPHFGAAVDSSNEASASNRFPNSPPGSESTQRTDRTILSSDGSAGITRAAQFDSKDATSFTLDWLTVGATALRYLWLALGGISVKAGSFNLSTSTGNQSVTGVGFQPEGIIFFSFCEAATDSVLSAGSFCYAAAKSSTERFVIAWDRPDEGNRFADMSLDRAQVFQAVTTTGTPVIDAEADFVSMDADGFTLNNGTVDATSRQVCFIAFGTNPVVPPLMSSYRRGRI